MKRRTIQIVLDVSMSMKHCVGIIYIFLNEFLDRISRWENTDWYFQLTVFSGGFVECIQFRNEKNYTQDKSEFMRIFREQKMKKGNVTCAEDVKAGCIQSMEQMKGKSGEQVLFLFTDYRMGKAVSMMEGKGVNRAFFFLPEDCTGHYRMPIVGKNNRFQIAMPVLRWPLENLKKRLSENEWESLLNYLKEGDENG